jgi:bis(5'-nucleosidyl)-tetraphosphatase
MPPPTDKPPITLSAGAVIVRRTDGGHRFLLLRAYRNWDFPKGLVEPGEEPMAAAGREVREETGITSFRFVGTDFFETPPYGRGKIARYFLAETEAESITLPVNPELGRPEHHEFRWLAHPEARALLVPRLQAVLDWAEGRLSTGAPRE